MISRRRNAGRRWARRGVFAAAAGAAALAQAGCPGTETRSEPDACVQAQALSAAPIFGTSLGPKELALTFDDGPGSRTLELSAYLKAQGIRAAFFVNGHCFQVGNGCGNNNPTRTAAQVLAQLVADGHLVANHTQTHPNLTQLPATPAGDTAMVNELALTDAVIAPYVQGGRFLFRAPFGAYDQRTYAVLHASAMDKYVGHIEWDVGGARTATTAADWACWQQNPKLTSAQCGDLYKTEIDAVGKGIVLFHDADYGNAGNTNPSAGTGNTVDMVKYMVPLLKAAGYTFKRVDEVPVIAALLPPLPPDAGADASDAAADAGSDGAADAASDAGAPEAAADAAPAPSPTPQPGPSTTPAPADAPDADPCAPAAPGARATAHAH